MNIMLPFNIASYAELAKILEEITGYEALGIEGALKCVHFYDNQYKPAKELIKRDPNKHGKCELIISDKVKDLCKNYNGNVDEIFNNMNIEDFKLKDYTCDDFIKVKMIAPISI